MEPEGPQEEPKEKPKDAKAADKPSEDKTRLSETVEKLKQNDKFESVLNYAKTHTQETVAYILIAIGLIWMIFNHFYGGILVGLVVGFYFSKEILHVIRSFNQFQEEQGTARTVILGLTLLALFLLAPGIFIGAAIMAGLKFMLRADD